MLILKIINALVICMSFMLPLFLFSNASSLLGSTGFIGFSDVMSHDADSGLGLSTSSSTEDPSSSTSERRYNACAPPPVSQSPFYTGDDPEINVICKKLLKKDR